MVSSIVKSLAVLCSFLALAKCEVHLGGCPASVQPKNPFELAQYAGVWYEIRNTPAAFQEGLKCVQANYTAIAAGKISVENKGQQANGTIQDILGEATVPDPVNEPARLLVTFPVAPMPAPYVVIASDYKSYAIVLSCTDLGMANYSILWVLSRTRVLPQAAESEVQNYFDQHRDLDYLIQKLVDTDQTNCV